MQKSPWFLEINPNGRVPALVDTFTDGEPIRLFESGSIMQYLVERYDTEGKISYPKNSRQGVEVTQSPRPFRAVIVLLTSSSLPSRLTTQGRR